jgi:subtilisin family serine protease
MRTTSLTSLLLVAALLVGCGGDATETSDAAGGPVADLPAMQPDGAAAPTIRSGSSKFVKVDQPFAGQYIVLLAEGEEIDAATERLVRRHRGREVHRYRSRVRGFAAQMTETDARALAEDPAVAVVEEDGIVEAFATQQTGDWGLDRIDQRAVALDGSFTYPSTGAGVTAYILDTGIRLSHQEFGGRAVAGADFVSPANGALDCNGHGTHVAGTVGGRVHGVAKDVRLVAVRVLDCAGQGLTSSVVAGVDWVTNNRRLPAVANMSLGGGRSTALDAAVQRSMAAGVTFVAAAGNYNRDACQGSPAAVPGVITVGASTRTDGRASYSDYGTCVDLFAPGSSIVSSWFTSDTATASLSGTSMAAPHAAGVVALALQLYPAASPAEVAAALAANSTAGVLANIGTGSPNRLLYTGFLAGGGQAGDATAPAVTLVAPANGATIRGTVNVCANASDDRGVARVDFRASVASGASISGTVGAPNAGPTTWCVGFPTTMAPNGPVQLAATAVDTSGNARSTSIVVNVAN